MKLLDLAPGAALLVIALTAGCATTPAASTSAASTEPSCPAHETSEVVPSASDLGVAGVLERFESAWNQGSEAALAEVLSPGADLVAPNGEILRGARRLRDASQSAFPPFTRHGARLSIRAIEGRPVGGDHLLLEAAWSSSRDGTTEARGFMTVVLERVGSCWRIVAVRSMLPALPCEQGASRRIG